VASHDYFSFRRDDAVKFLSTEILNKLDEMMDSLQPHPALPQSEAVSGVDHSMESYFSKVDLKHPLSCPECGSHLVHRGGCVECSDPGCGWSACS